MSQFRLARLGLLLAAIGLTAPALLPCALAQDKPAAADAEKKQDTVRPELYKLIDPKLLQPLLNEKKFDQVKELLDKTSAIADQTPYEAYVVDRMRLALAIASNNQAMLVPLLEKLVDNARLQPEERQRFTLALAESYYNAQQYPKSIAAFERYKQLNPVPDAGAAMRLTRAYYLNKDYAKALPLLQAEAAAAEAAGKAPEAQTLQLIRSCAALTKNNPALVEALEKTALYHPDDDSWTNLLSHLMNRPGFDQRLIPFAFRLEFEVVKQMEGSYYTDLADLDMSSGFWTEAKQVLDAGFANGALGSGPDAAAQKKMREKADRGAADDAKHIASGEASALKKPDGIGLLNLGYAYVTMGQFDKGLDFMQKGIAKGLKHADEGKLLLGIAYHKAGRKDDALKTFDSVAGDAIIKDLARYWAIYVRGPLAGAAK